MQNVLFLLYLGMNRLILTLEISDDKFDSIPFDPKLMPLSDLIKIIGDRPVAALNKTVKRDPIFSHGKYPTGMTTGYGEINFIG